MYLFRVRVKEIKQKTMYMYKSFFFKKAREKKSKRRSFQRTPIKDNILTKQHSVEYATCLEFRTFSLFLACACVYVVQCVPNWNDWFLNEITNKRWQLLKPCLWEINVWNREFLYCFLFQFQISPIDGAALSQTVIILKLTYKEGPKFTHFLPLIHFCLAVEQWKKKKFAFWNC